MKEFISKLKGDSLFSSFVLGLTINIAIMAFLIYAMYSEILSTKLVVSFLVVEVLSGDFLDWAERAEKDAEKKIHFYNRNYSVKL